MTREEAISKAINIVRYCEAHFAKSKEAREDAANIIEALEQEPCEDCISRESIIEIVNHQRFGMSRIAFDIITEKLMELPSVTPQPKGSYNSIKTELEPSDDWIDVPSDQMTLEQARAAVKDLRKALAMEKGAYNALVKTVQCEDAVSRQGAIDAIEKYKVQLGHGASSADEAFNDGIETAIAEIGHNVPSVVRESRTGWIPVKWHTITDEERERESYPKEWVNHVDCVMPEDGQEILVTVKGRNGDRWVEKDTNYIDDGFYLDSGYDWVEDVVAWCELPEPYKESQTGAEGSEE